jgi:hypothetical protein
MFWKIWNPILSGFEDAPMTAIREGRNRGDRGEGNFGSGDII